MQITLSRINIVAWKGYLEVLKTFAIIDIFNISTNKNSDKSIVVIIIFNIIIYNILTIITAVSTLPAKNNI